MQVITRLFITILFAFLTSPSNAEIIISPVMSIDATQQSYVIAPRTYTVVPLPGRGSPLDTYKISINADNAVYKDITAFLVDEANLNLFKQGQPYKGIGYQKAVAPFVIQGEAQTSGPHYLILDNSYASLISKKLRLTIEGKFPLDPAERKTIENGFAAMYANLKKLLIFPDFNIRIEPCGQVNAFSETFGSGDVHYCTEMISLLAKTKNQGAFTAIFLHEVGHSLLGLWGIPGNNNEDIADEFSTYVLMSGGPSGYALLDRSFEFWQNRDSMAEAMNMLKNGDRHSLSIQRIRNIKENMQRGETFIKRWNQLIYQHETSEALNKVINNPQHGDDVELARSILEQRSELVNSTSKR